MIRARDFFLAGLVLLMALHVFALCYGIITQHYRVPTYDLWRTGVGILDAVEAGGWGYFTEIHNQHWIVWTKLLLYVDQVMPWQGTEFLILVNFLLLIVLMGITFLIARRFVPDRRGSWVLLGLSVFLGLSLTQNQNLYWAFQSQFFLVYMFALGSFCFFARALVLPEKGVYFWLACLLALLSAFSMGNGLTVLPALVVFALLARADWKRVLVLLLLGAALWGIYLSTEGAMDAPAREQTPVPPHAYLLYVAGFFGNPFYRAMPMIQPMGAYAIGFIFILLAAGCFLLTLFSEPSRQRMERLGVLFFVGFLLVSAGLAAWSRVPLLGVEQSFSSRYATPVLMGWILLCALYLRVWRGRTPQAAWLLPALAAGWFFPYQLSAFADERAVHHQRATAVLALSMGVYDSERVEHIGPMLVRDEGFLDLVAPQRTTRRGIFGKFPFSAAIDSLDREMPAAEEGRYAWHVDLAKPVDGAPGFFFFEGWIVDRQEERVPRGFYLLDHEGRVIGFGIAGNPRVDVADYFGTQAFERAGFRGYVRAADRDRWTHVAEP